MKKMLPLLIGVLLVVAAAYYFMKNKNVSLPVPAGGDGGSNSKKILDLNDTDSIIDSLSLSGNLNSKAKGWVKTINKAVSAGEWDKSKLQTSAKDNDITYSQQIVLSSLWQMYATSGLITQSQYKSLEEELLSLGE